MSEVSEHLVAPEPEHCPGTQSESAGKASACEGCPNKAICEAGLPKAIDPDVARIAANLEGVKHKVLVLSGKGGVGKSTMTAMLARGLCASDPELSVGVLDIDLCGPSTPRLFGVEGEQVHQSGSGWCPIFVNEQLSVMSAGFLLGSADAALIWRGPKKNGLIKQLLRDVDWDKLDVLLIDTPPGTSDEHISIVQLMKDAGVTGAVVVTTPQEVSLLDVRKELDFCKKVNLSVLGLVENMSSFVCPKCEKGSNIFPASTGGARKLSLDTGIPLFGQIPLDPRVGRTCDEGIDIFDTHPDAIVTKAYVQVVQKLKDACKVGAMETD